MLTHTPTAGTTQDLKEVKGLFPAYEQTNDHKIFDTSVQQKIMQNISMHLQRSLEVEWVIQSFMQAMHSFLLFDGYNYRNSEPGVHLETGRQQGHKFSYNLSIDDAQLGELRVYRGRKYTSSELTFFENILSALIYPLRNAIHFRQATMLAHRDTLTGLKNRSTFDGVLQREINLALRKKDGFSVLVIDIDFFKKVNDNYGHSAGDEVLKVVAESLQASVRMTDLVFRYGGEEFVALLNNASCETAYAIADRILQSIRAVKVDYKGQVISVSASIGLACLKNIDTATTLFDRADIALYKAKDAGRDQIKMSTA
jgi:diguanylate cyclase (GGDEF)-like protein